jgi:hypothetical protein
MQIKSDSLRNAATLAMALVLFGTARAQADDLGTTHGSRTVQLANGRAQISVRLFGRQAVIGVGSPGLPAEFLNLQMPLNQIESGVQPPSIWPAYRPNHYVTRTGL